MRLLHPSLLILAILAPAAFADDVQIVSRESLGRVPVEGTDDFQLVTNKDLSKVAVMDRWGDEHKWYVVQNSILWEFYTDLDAASAQFSPDGRHLSLLARHDDQWFLITDNKDARPLGAQPCRGLALSPDGKHDACIQQTDSGRRVLVDGRPLALGWKRQASFDEIPGVSFSRDGKLAFSARAGGKAYVVLEGKILNAIPADHVLPAAFSADGEHLNCTTSLKDGTGTHITHMVDGTVQSTYSTPLTGTDVTALTPSVDGGHLTWNEKDADGSRVLIDGQKLTDTLVPPTKFVLSGDGKHVAWLSVSGGLATLRMDAESQTLWGASKDAVLSLSDDGRSLRCTYKWTRHDFILERDHWVPDVVAASEDDRLQVVARYAVTVNGQSVESGKFLEARVADSQTAYILTQSDLPVQVNDKKLGEIVRTVVHLNKTPPPGG